MRIEFHTKKWIFGLAISFFANYSMAENPNFTKGFDEGLKYANSCQAKPMSAMENLHPENFISNYSQSPKEIAYNGNVDAMKNDSAYSRDHGEIGKSITNGMDERKQKFNFPIDPNSPAIKNIDKRGDDIYSVITGQFGDCTKKTSCTTEYKNETCQESPRSTNQYCRKVLNIDLVPKQVDTHYYLTVHLTTSDHDYAGVNINSVTGNVNGIGPHDARASLDGRLPSGIDCNSLHGSIVNFDSKNPNTHLDNITYPSCGSGLNLDFHVSNAGRKGTVNLNMKIDMVSSKIIYEPHDVWDDQCSLLESSSSCKLVEEHCIAPGATRVIQNVPVTRDCWEKEANFVCGGGSETLQCQPYRDKGCEQVSSICKNHNDSGCTLFEETFRCPIKTCTDVGTICNGETYCLTGDCVKQTKQADADFQRGVTGLSVVNEAAKNYSINQGANFPIFGGQYKTCNKDFLNFANCCSDSGWGVDLHLGQCDQEAKDLGKAKENNLTTYVDSEDNCVLGLCSHKKRYCVFPSKLARIIQEKGRHDQLHISFGNFDHPDCRGITPDEFSKLDLSKIDFSEIYSDITKKESFENRDDMNKRIDDKMQQWSKEHAPHG